MTAAMRQSSTNSGTLGQSIGLILALSSFLGMGLLYISKIFQMLDLLAINSYISTNIQTTIDRTLITYYQPQNCLI